MTPAIEPRSIRESARLLVIDSKERAFRDARITDLPEILQPGDLLVLNDAATIPASIRAWTKEGASVEIRLAGQAHGSDWFAVLLGEGDWRTPTELRETADAVDRARAQNRRVVAIGTTVVRALEGCAASLDGRIMAGRGQTSLVIDRSFRRGVVTGILTGIHDPAQSHFRLLHAFADETTLRRAWRHAKEADYLCHEFGETCLILPSS